MILSDRDIIENLDSGHIICTPLDRANISNSSIDLRLGRYIAKQSRQFKAVKFSTDSSGRLTVLNPIKPKVYDLLNPKIRDSHKFIIQPCEFILAQTLEVVGSTSPSIECRVSDKSTLARLGLSVCFSSGKIEPGNVLCVTLELKNHSCNAIELQYGMHCCQLEFHQLTSPVTRMYGGKYLYSQKLEIAI